MPVTYGTLAQVVDGKVTSVYPKTDSSIVEYPYYGSVRDKLQSIDNDINTVNNRITTLIQATDYGSISTKNDRELIDIRVPNYNLTPKDAVYQSAGDAIRNQFEILFGMITAIQKDIEEIKNNINN